jgi:hypothetical protein
LVLSVKNKEMTEAEAMRRYAEGDRIIHAKDFCT